MTTKKELLKFIENLPDDAIFKVVEGFETTSGVGAKLVDLDLEEHAYAYQNEGNVTVVELGIEF